MERLTDTCYYDQENELAVIQPQDQTMWVVIDKGSKLFPSSIVFGPSTLETCLEFVDRHQVSNG
jgi:hypothetical protein